LDFGWSLADVLRKSKENAKNSEQNKDKPSEDKKGTDKESEVNCIEEKEEEETGANLKEKSANEILTEEERKLCGDWMEIGTWSNDMANHDPVSVGIPVCLCFQYISSLKVKLSLCLPPKAGI
jgi:endoribonuclease Dicer